MSDLYNRIMELCAAKGISGYKLCRATKTSHSTLTDLKMGRKKSLTTDCLSRFAFYLDVSMKYLLGKEQKESPPPVEDRLSKKQKALIAAVAELPEDMVSFLLVDAKDWLKNHKSADSAE